MIQNDLKPLASFAFMASASAYQAFPGTARIVGSADFNGDGYANIVYEDPISGVVTVWLGDNWGAVLGTRVIANTPVADFHLHAVADWNGDGVPDLLYQSVSTGVMKVGYTNGTAVTSWGTVSSALQSRGWKGWDHAQRRPRHGPDNRRPERDAARDRGHRA